MRRGVGSSELWGNNVLIVSKYSLMLAVISASEM